MRSTVAAKVEASRAKFKPELYSRGILLSDSPGKTARVLVAGAWFFESGIH